MKATILLIWIATLALSISAVNCSTLYRPFTGDEDFEDTINTVPDDDFDDDPIFQPRFLPFLQDNAATITKVAEALQNPGNKTLQDNLFNIITDVALKTFGGDETVKKVIGVVKNSQNKTFRDIVMDVAAEVAIIKLGGNDDTIKKIAEVLKNPGNKTIQESLINIAADVADTKLKGNGTLTKVAEVLQKPGNRTLQENLLNVLFEVGASKYGDNDLFKTVAEVYKNSGNKTMEENLINLATSIVLTQYGSNPIIKMVATSLQNSGNGTLNERLTAMADAGLTAVLGPVQAALIKQGIGVAGQALKVGGSLLGGALADIGGNSTLGRAGQAISNGSLAVGGFMSAFGGGDKGVGAAIEKFGESLKGNNVTVQQALEMAGNTLNVPVSTVEKDVSEAIEQIVKTEETLADVVESETKSSIVSSQTTASDSSKTETVSQAIVNALTSSNQAVTQSVTIQEAPQVITEVAEEVKSEGNNTPVDVDQSTVIGAQKALEATSASENTNQASVEQYNTPLISANQQVSKQEESVQINDASVVANEAARTSIFPASSQLVNGVRRLDTGVNQGSQFSEQATVPSQSTTMNNFGGSVQSSQGNSGTATNNAFRGNSYFQNPVNQGTTTNNFGASVQNGQVGSGVVTDSSGQTMYSQNVANQGGSYSSGALGSAAEAIEAARQALQAGGMALGGALGSVGGSSGNSGISMRQTGGAGGVMNIEITQVKLKMI